MINCWYNGQIDLRKGDILKITRSIKESENRFRITTFENITSGSPYRSRDEGTVMTVSPIDIDPPIVGMVSQIISRRASKIEFVVRQIKTNIPTFHEDGTIGIHVFISSAMNELKSEREKAALAIFESGSIPIYFEKFKPQDTPAEETMINELNNCHIYLGLFAAEYSEATIKEFEQAKKLGMPQMIFIKKIEERDDRLSKFIEVLKSEEGLTYKPFETPQELKLLLMEYLPDIINDLFID
jgi:hypothetical protein